MTALSQTSDFQKIKTNKSQFGFTAINHASMIFDMDGKIIYVDPYGPAEWYQGITKADLVIITDIHQDHYSEKTLKSVISEKTKFIAPPAVQAMMPEDWQNRTDVLKNGQVKNLDHMQIMAIPMYNFPESPDAGHIKGRGNGYILEYDDFKLYISGDTGPTPEMKSLKQIDMAFVCMNVPYTMSVEDAASAVIAFKPKVVYPYHYRNGDNSLGDVNKFAELVGAQGIECVLLNWYP